MLFIPLAVTCYVKECYKGAGTLSNPGIEKGFVNQSELHGFCNLKVPKCEIFHLFDFNDFYGIKSL